ncbi:MAG: phosphoglucosamine mutase [Calditrichaeota bacterium]|nr:MAG: phosphoglucosamine mutase [Calditrichota bacterium]
MRALMTSVSGVRGVVGDTLTPETVIKYVQAFAEPRAGHTVVVGGDPRVSQNFLRPLVKAVLLATGCNVIDIGVTPTPTVQIATEHLKAAGGIAITASHNPIQWNGLKFIGADGLFLPEKEVQELYRRAEHPERAYASWKELGREESYPSAIEDHLQKIYELSYIDAELIRSKRFKVVLDCVNGAGGLIVPQMLEYFGCEIIGLNLEPTGMFAHTPEPVPQNLGELMEAVKAHKADIGFAVDPDADRCAIIGNDGNPLGEEYTLALAVKFILSKKLGPVVTNLSTSRAIDDIVQYYNCLLYKTKVGEINVADKMREVQAVIGGEGNGGVILPEVHLGRDAPVAVALTLQHLAEWGKSVAELKQTLPQYYIVKDKAPLGEVNPEQVMEHFAQKFSQERLDFTDGLRIDRPDSWIHLRKSNTEPIMRIIVEARTPDIAWRIVQEVKEEISRL